MKIICPICERPVPRKRTVPLIGMIIKRGKIWKVPRVCSECFALPDDELKRLYGDGTKEDKSRGHSLPGKPPC